MDKIRECATWLWLHNPEFRRWRIAVIESAMRHWWTEWQKHPDFEGHPYNDEPHNPIIQLAVEHEPGVGGRTRSFIIGSLLGVTAPKQIALARKMGHSFTLEAILPDHPVDPWFVSVLSYSYAGRGRGYWARRYLKELLPKRLHRLITKVRRLNRMAKYKFLPVREPGMPNWSRETWPDWYREHTKGEIIMLRELSDEEHGDLSVYVDPMDFFRIVTGKVHPGDVQSYVLHQPQLF